MFDFPNTPTVGQAYSSYVWDGEKWVGGAQGSTVYVSDSAPAAPVGALWFESDTGILYIRYNDGNSSQWVAIAAGGIDVGAVRFDSAQTLTSETAPFGTTVTQRAQARKNVYAAPFDALAYSGMQFNGSMEVSQELGTTGRTTDGYICDGWRIDHGGTMVQSAVSVLSPTIAGFNYVLASPTLTAQASLTAGDYVTFIQKIEGYRLSRLAWGTVNAQPITIGFWSWHTRTGTYSVGLRNLAGTRTYMTTYTQNASAAPEFKTITIPGCTDGVWEFGNLVGASLIFSNGCGTTYTAPSANAWLPSNYLAAPGQVNAVAATSDVFRLSGVVVLPGIEAPSAARSPLITRPYDQELLTCKRYWQPLTMAFEMLTTAAGQYILSNVNYPVEMRAAPSLTLATGSPVNATFYGTALAPTKTSAQLLWQSIAVGRAFGYSDYYADARL